jgi:hypothetical protein
LRFKPKGSAWFMHAIVLFGNTNWQNRYQRTKHFPLSVLLLVKEKEA